MVELAKNIYIEIVENCMPVAVLFAICNISIRMIVTSAFGGKLWIGKE